MFKYATTVRLFDTDAAGVLFFGNQFRLAHAAYEEFMGQNGISFDTILRDGKIMLPITKAEADYQKPLRVGEKLTIAVRADGITEHSYTLLFELRKNDDSVAGRIRTVHVCVDAETWEKVPLSPLLKGALESILS